MVVVSYCHLSNGGREVLGWLVSRCIGVAVGYGIGLDFILLIFQLVILFVYQGTCTFAGFVPGLEDVKSND